MTWIIHLSVQRYMARVIGSHEKYMCVNTVKFSKFVIYSKQKVTPDDLQLLLKATTVITGS